MPKEMEIRIVNVTVWRVDDYDCFDIPYDNDFKNGQVVEQYIDGEWREVPLITRYIEHDTIIDGHHQPWYTVDTVGKDADRDSGDKDDPGIEGSR